MTVSERVKRINELARKQKSVGLTAEEKAEQTTLRNEYIANLRESFRAQLEAIEFVDDEPKKD